jgi:hypothetical protein
MNKRVTLHLRDDIIARALKIADSSQRELEEVLAEWIDRYANDLPVETLSNDEVLALCEFELNPISQHELRNLLFRQQEYKLSVAESARLDELLQIYRRGIARKARAIEVASARGLLDRPSDGLS